MTRGSGLVLFLLVIVLGITSALDDRNEWDSSPQIDWFEAETPCTIPRLHAPTLVEFLEASQGLTQPLILTGISDNSVFVQDTQKKALLDMYGDKEIVLSTANTNSYEKVILPFREYVDLYMGPHDVGEDGSKTLYHFGNNDYEEWSWLFDRYQKPRDDILKTALLWSKPEDLSVLTGLISSFKKSLGWSNIQGRTKEKALKVLETNVQAMLVKLVEGKERTVSDEVIEVPEPSETEMGSMASRSRSKTEDGTALSFGLGGSGSGVPFHTHGPVFAEVSHGQKRWFLYPPEIYPEFKGDETSLTWLHRIYPRRASDPDLLECTLKPGEILYLPNLWFHATLNIGQSVFMSVFI